MLMQEAQKYGITELAYTQEDEWAAVKGVKGG
jgi:hypothetical protein